MKDISDEELLKFISENKDRLIQYMKAEGINLVDVTRKNVKEGVSKVNEAATNIKDDLEITTNFRMRDVEEAQQRIVDIIRDLEEKGVIVIMKGGKDDIIA